MSKANQWRAFALLTAFFFAAAAHSSNDAISQRPIAEAQSTSRNAVDAVIKQPDLAALPNAMLPPPANPAVTTLNKTAFAEVGKSIEGKPDVGNPGTDQPNADQPNADQPNADKPNAGKPNSGEPSAGNSSGIFADLSASKRLAISVLAGVFTLIAALWIGARRD